MNPWARNSSPTPGQPSEGPSPGPTADAILAGLQALLGGQTAAGGESSVEQVKYSWSEFPKLAEPGADSSLVFTDWLHSISPCIEDMSPTSADLWGHLQAEASSWYASYMGADPIARLLLVPSPSQHLTCARWSRVSKRLEALFLGACPKSVREELIASRIRSPLAILCRLHVLYAPGGVQEREMALQKLQQPSPGTNPQTALESLRRWKRWLTSVEALGGGVPDPLILAKALGVIVKPVLEASPEVLFRINLVRATLKIEAAPTLSVVMSYHAALTAELETLSRTKLKQGSTPSAQAVIGPDPPEQNKGKGNGKGGASPKGNGKGEGASVPIPQGACKFFVQGTGCNKGDTCSHAHTWTDIPSHLRKGRCMACGGTGHMKSACPKVAAPGTPSPKPKPNPKAKPPVGTEATHSPHNKVNALLDDAAKVLQALHVNGVSESPPSPPPAAAKPTGTSSSAQTVVPGTPVTVAALQSQLDALRKAVPDAKPSVQAVSGGVHAASLGGPGWNPSSPEPNHPEQMALIDSGATHPVRALQPEDAERGVTYIEVGLAGGASKIMPQTAAGTLLTEEKSHSQAIVPAGALVEQLGCSISWKRGKIVVTLQVRIRNGCPVLAETEALRLIEELEMKRLQELEDQVEDLQATLTSLSTPKPFAQVVAQARATGSRLDLLQAAASVPFYSPEDRVHLGTQTPTTEKEAWKVLKGLPLPRRTRRSLLGSADWVLRFVHGKHSLHDEDQTLLSRGFQVVTVDLEKPKQWSLQSGSPVHTALVWAALQGHLAGIQATPGSQSHVVALVTWLWTLSTAMRKYTIPLTAAFRSSQIPESPLWKGFETWAGLPPVVKGRGNEEVWLSTNCRTEEMCASATWSNLLQNMVKAMQPSPENPCAAAIEALDREIEEGLQRDGISMQEPLDPKEMGWWNHIRQGHLPYRRDCRACVYGSAVGLQHRRVPYPASFSLSCDLLGPLPEKGLSEESVAGKARHFRVPTELLDKSGWGNVEASLRDLFDKDLLEEMRKEGGKDLGVPKVPLPRPDEKDHSPHPSTSNPDPLEKGPSSHPSTRSPDPLEKVPQASVPEPSHLASDDPAWERVHAGDESEDLVSCEVEAQELEEDDRYDLQAFRQTIAFLQEPVPQTVLRFARSIPSKKATAIIPALHSIISEIHQLGFPVRSLHTDQGREFLSDGVKNFCSDHGISVRMSEPHDKRANGLAERIVGWAKQRTRCLLTAARLDRKFWPLAMGYATATHLSMSTGKRLPAYFGQQVTYKRPVLPGHLKPWEPWADGRYMCPSQVVVDGHVVLKGDGNLIVVKNVRSDLVDAEQHLGDRLPAVVADGIESRPPASSVSYDPERDLPEADRFPHKNGPLQSEAAPSTFAAPAFRVTRKTPGVPASAAPLPKPSPARRRIVRKTAARAVRLEVRGEEEARSLLAEEDFRPEIARELLDHVFGSWKKPGTAIGKGRGGHAGCILGAYAYGSIKKGITLCTSDHPWLTRYLNEMIARSSLETSDYSADPATWTSLVVIQSDEVPPHRDLNNEQGTHNHLLCLDHVHLWTEGTAESNPVKGGGTTSDLTVCDPTGREHSGRVTEVSKKLVTFDARKWHSVVRTRRWTLAGYTPRGWDTSLAPQLQDLGFRVPPRTQVAMLRPQNLASSSSSSSNAPQDGESDTLAGGSLPPGSSSASGQVSSLDTSTQETQGSLPSHMGHVEDEELIRVLMHLGQGEKVEALGNLGVETLADLDRLYLEDLLEAGWIQQDARALLTSTGRPMGLAPRPMGSSTIRPAFLTKMASSSAASRPGQIPEAPEEADSSCGASVGSGPWHDPRMTPALVELIPQRLYDEGQEMGPISPALYAELVHVGNEADLVVRENDAYYAEGAFQDVLRGYRVGTNGLDPIVGGLLLRDLARYRRETFGLEGETEESPYTTDSSHTLPEVRALSTLALQRHTSPSPDRAPAVQLNPSILLRLEDVEDSVAVFHRPLGSGASAPFGVPEEVEQLTQLLKVDLYTQDVEGKLEALNGAPLETAYNVSPAEIRRFSDRWKASMVDEFNSLIEKGAIKRVFGEEAARLKRDPSSKVLHTKTVCVAKPGKAGEPFRRKTRIVACGCESEYTDESNLYASGVVADSLRSSLVKAATESWQAHATDIHTAFLRAPWPGSSPKTVHPSASAGLGRLRHRTRA